MLINTTIITSKSIRLSEKAKRRKHISPQTAEINWLDSGEPYSKKFQDFYFSSDGGLIETEYVFLKHNGFPQRFCIDAINTDNKPIKIAETGFGTGLNFLVSVCHWLQVSDLKKNIDYISVEKYPLNQSQLEQAYAIFRRKWPQLNPICEEFLKHYPSDLSLIEDGQLEFALFDQRIQLKLLLNDATTGLQQILSTHKNAIDAWYLDGFAPAKNPDMWRKELFETIAQLSKSGCTLSTFTSAGFVRRGLIEAGFNMSKAPGLGKKREVLYGIKE